MIHPTAIIHPKAELGLDVSVGAYAIIEERARIGDRCTIHAHAVILPNVEIGEDNFVGHGAIIGGDPQDLSFRPEIVSGVRIGRANKIREYVTIHRGSTPDSRTLVGDNCFIMAGAHLGHDVELGSHVILANNVLLGGYVRVFDRVFIGGGAVLHQHIWVGKLAICQGGSALSRHVPPFVMAARHNGVAGLNVVGMRRAGLTAAERAEIKAAYELLYHSGLNASQALATAAERVWGDRGREFWDFISTAKKRGFIYPLGRRAESEMESSGR